MTAPEEAEAAPADPPVRRRRGRKLVTRTLVRAWDDNIFSEAAAAAFWQTLSLPPLLLGLFGILSYVGDFYGPDTVAAVQAQVVDLVGRVFSREAVEDIIAPTVADILTTARAEVISIGFVISLWSGSSAMSSFVDAITRAHEQYLLRNPVWQRTLALLLYALGLVTGIIALPIVAIGPERPARLLPESWQPTARPVIDLLLSPPVIGLVLMLALTTLYKIALPLKPPWYRGLPGALLAAVVFLAGATGLRAYLDWLTGTGYTYGALAAPIAFLLGTFFIGLAIVLGAHFNASIQALWPVPLRDRRNRMSRASEKVSAAPGDSVAPAGSGIAATTGSVMPDELPDVLLSPDVTILERAVRERPDVAAAVLDQMRYGQLRSGVQSGGTPGRNGSGADDQADETDAGPGPEPGAARDDGPDRVGGDRR
ncbi:YihY/virulence factor BrkB family protein [Pseudonocardia charpentierae]|uniref:YihY/virulence factor BrkB family protein n=1 Tax=Pseudonocardia charpentierae TaxID=3075545 RepID=A0ABU2NBE8_9PSEU|nr:YihY/virulence factor BrkB family protein [Pseudonocardia sp. DSM 45834]MDT0351275.1 YihY/virulence factor BrkB family protein [Pseudonocardia sp. DSM 45834]